MAGLVFGFWAVVILGGLMGVCYLVLGVVAVIEKVRRPHMRSSAASELRSHFTEIAQGTINPALVCPHCQTRGKVRTQAVNEKKGVSGGKATAALLTGGTSMLVTGLSRKEKATKATCGSCNSTWMF